MAITSETIQQQSFAIDRRGYDVDEVDVFLEQVADEIDILNNRIAELEAELASRPEVEEDVFSGFDTPAAVEETEDQSAIIFDLNAQIADKDSAIDELRAQLANARADSNAIAQALIVAQRSADDIIAGAKDRAADIIADARVEADEIVNAAEDTKADIEDDIASLLDERADTRTQYQNILQNFIADATLKLSNLGNDEYANIMASAHARAAKAVVAEPVEEPEPEPVEEPAPAVEVYEEAPAYATAPMSTPIFAAATPTPSSVEKDFSGFGDTDDGFGFDVD